MKNLVLLGGGMVICVYVYLPSALPKIITDIEIEPYHSLKPEFYELAELNQTRRSYEFSRL